MRIALPTSNKMPSSMDIDKPASVSISHRFAEQVGDVVVLKVPSSMISSDELPSVTESDVSTVGSSTTDDEFSVDGGCFSTAAAAAAAVVASTSSVPQRIPLQWEFYGLTLWVEYEEFDNDLSKALDHTSALYGTERIPIAHSTAAYGMMHLTDEEAIQKLRELPSLFPNGWPSIMGQAVGIKQDIAQVGRPGEVCNIAWAEITFKSNDQHEAAVDKIHAHFEIPQPRTHHWTPHISLAYDNPEDHILTLTDILLYAAGNPTLMQPRRINAVSLWSTRGKMGDWKCLERVSLD